MMIASGSLSCVAELKQKKLCDAIKVEKNIPAAFLVDENLDIAPGPINLRRQVFQASYSTDWHEFSTPYKIVLVRKRITVKQSHLKFSLIYKPTTPLCVNSTTFSIGVGGSIYAGDERPATRVESIIEPGLYFNDPLNDTPAPTVVNLKFDARILIDLERN